MIPERELLGNLRPEDFDPKFEIVKDEGPFKLIAKQIRLSKPERDLTALAPRSLEITQDFQLKDVYQMRLDPLGTAGFHYHQQKMEIIYPLGELELYFHEIDTGKTIAVIAPERFTNIRFGFLVKHRVAHAIRNPQNLPVFYTVLSNMFEEEAELKKDIIPLKFPLPECQPLPKFLKLDSHDY